MAEFGALNKLCTSQAVVEQSHLLEDSLLPTQAFLALAMHSADCIFQVQANRRMQEHGCLAVMAGRGALIKPWLFQEFRDQRELNPSTAERFKLLMLHLLHPTVVD